MECPLRKWEKAVEFQSRIKYNSVDERETAMMGSGWHYKEMSHQIPKEEQKNIEPCCACFSKLVLLGEVEA